MKSKVPDHPLPVVTIFYKNVEFVDLWFKHMELCKKEDYFYLVNIQGGCTATNGRVKEHMEGKKGKVVLWPENLGLALALNWSARWLSQTKSSKDFAWIESDIFVNKIGTVEAARELLWTDPNLLYSAWKLYGMRKDDGIHNGTGASVFNMLHFKNCRGYPFGYRFWCEDFELKKVAEKLGIRGIKSEYGFASHFRNGTSKQVVNQIDHKHDSDLFDYRCEKML